MTSKGMDKLVTHLADLLNQHYDQFALQGVFLESLSYGPDNFRNFLTAMVEKAYKVRVALLQNGLSEEEMKDFLGVLEHPVVVFKDNEEAIEPLLVYPDHKGNIFFRDYLTNEEEEIERLNDFVNSLAHHDDRKEAEFHGKIWLMTAFPLEYLAQESGKEEGPKPSPLRRFLNLLNLERKDITYIYIYALAITIINLSLPLGIQGIVSLISGGMVLNSALILIIVVVMGVLIGGGLQIMQITLVEVLQRRVFARTSFEFAYRIPRISYSSYNKYYPPELINRFFDVMTIQKGLPKFLIDITAAFLQVIFSVVVLAFYHPYFIFFGAALLTYLFLIFYFTGNKGMRTSLMESKYKYQVAHWLEEVGRNIVSFKLSGNSPLAARKTDYLVNQYLYNRKQHFGVLVTQFVNILAFKTLITGGLLIIGTLLVVNREITLGQFVASEILIILTLNASEKIFMNMDVVFDLLTGIEKVSNVTDLPLERQEGLHLAVDKYPKGVRVLAKNLSYRYPEREEYTLRNLNFTIEAGESVCLTGTNGSGQNTLLNIISGLITQTEGYITLNDVSMHDIDLAEVRKLVEKKLHSHDIFWGSMMENITMGRAHVTYDDVIWAVNNIGLDEEIYRLPNGLQSELLAGGNNFSETAIHKINLARCVADRPKLLLIDDFLRKLNRTDRLKILNFLMDKENPWGLLAHSNDPLILGAVDKILLMDWGTIVASGTFEELRTHPIMQEVITNPNFE